ncbi:MAG: pyridoxamine 5'-phosphate oxidase family protein [Clostridiales bacterium]|jgi:uncharacterized pyridoxamine 5'-phosphate oxidase family protein|nr:pyridoxamine 5'-phosphate oxidase family protein [Clostridiales bacterium]
MQAIAEFLSNFKPFYIATIDGDQPRVRPFGASAVVDGKLYIVTNSQKSVAAQLKANPKIEISTTAADGRWLRLTAEAVLDKNPASEQSVLEKLPQLKNLYKDSLVNFEAYYLKNAAGLIVSRDGTSESHTF